MKINFFHRIDLWIRNKYPIAMAVLALFFMMVPFKIPHYSFIKPEFLLSIIYFWAVHKPENLGNGKVFLLGLFSDLFEGTPIGITSLTFVVTFATASQLRRFIINRPFIVSFWGLAIIGLGAFFIKWFLVSSSCNQFLPLKEMFISYLLTLAFYPVIGWLGAKAHAAILRD